MTTWLVVLVWAACNMLHAAGQESKDKPLHSVYSPAGIPNSTLLNINRIAGWYDADGIQETSSATGNAGFTFPRGTATAIFGGGLIWGGIFNDGRTPLLRVNGQSYDAGTKPGAILGIRTGIAEDPTSPDVRIWRIRGDYATADLTQDAAEFFRVPMGSVTQAQIDSVRNQYARDWSEWPWRKGAPFYDVNGNGVKDTREDPGLLDADQVIWYVCNDIGVAQPWTNVESGIEQQTTIWGYARSDALGNAIFKRFRLFYKGIASTPVNATIDSMYIAQFTDTDIGQSSNDYAGCDSARSLGYGYNATPSDPDYSAFGLAPPAAGTDLLQGPIVFSGDLADTAVFDFQKVPGAKNLPLTSFAAFAASGIYSDPLLNAGGGVEWYLMLRGLPPICQGYLCGATPWRNPVTGEPTLFWYTGDPVTGTGWTWDISDAPRDVRILLPSGPFSMAVGDSQEIIVATVAGLGTSNLNSITVLRFYDDMVQQWYESLVAGIVTDVKEPVSGIPNSFVLEQNYPNPFNPTTTIRFSVGTYGHTSLRVFDVLGRAVATLVNEMKQPGTHEVTWDASEVASGVYFYKFKAGDFVVTKRMVLIR